jgi:hypothetical protein
MNIRTKIHNWLGISDLFLSLSGHAAHIDRDLAAIRKQLDVIGPGLGRVIAKLDAKYAESEHSPERKAESDKLAEETIRRLHAEAAARAPYNE